jgi:hypothetical protein
MSVSTQLLAGVGCQCDPDARHVLRQLYSFGHQSCSSARRAVPPEHADGAALAERGLLRGGRQRPRSPGRPHRPHAAQPGLMPRHRPVRSAQHCMVPCVDSMRIFHAAMRAVALSAFSHCGAWPKQLACPLSVEAHEKDLRRCRVICAGIPVPELASADDPLYFWIAAGVPQSLCRV